MPRFQKKSSTERATRDRPDPAAPLGPNQFIRLRDAHLYFGLQVTQVDEHIKRGNIPEPITISDSTEKGKGSRARGWFGQQILSWQAARMATPRPVRASRSKKA